MGFLNVGWAHNGGVIVMDGGITEAFVRSCVVCYAKSGF